MSNVKLLISVDYELFFGSKTGSVQRSLIEPTDALAACVEQAGHRLSIFVDAGFLCRAREQGCQSEHARTAHAAVARQLTELAGRGHDLQLHIHPHWQDCRIRDGAWEMRTERYRLHDFDDAEIAAIVHEYKTEIETIKQAAVFAYRAGGWCLQPFARLADPLRQSGIWLDSTVYAGGYSEVRGREYDFRGAPLDRDTWRFNQDPLAPESDGYFLEVPISACRYGATAFWALARRRLFATDADRPFGDGAVMRATSSYYLRRLVAPTWSPVSIDQSKAGLLDAVFSHYLSRPTRGDLFNIMGHPKSLTPSGLASLGRFLRRLRETTVSVTYADFSHLEPAAARRTP